MWRNTHVLTDSLAYNQAVSRQLSYITDLLLVARIRAAGPGRLPRLGEDPLALVDLD